MKFDGLVKSHTTRHSRAGGNDENGTKSTFYEFVKFGYEDLVVWHRAVDFAVKVIEVVEKIEGERKHYRLLEQIEASSTSVSMNLAEGKGRNSKKEFVQYCYIARGSLYETMTLLEIFKRKSWITEKDFTMIKSEGIEIASMIKGLINSIIRTSSKHEAQG